MSQKCQNRTLSHKVVGFDRWHARRPELVVGPTAEPSVRHRTNELGPSCSTTRYLRTVNSSTSSALKRANSQDTSCPRTGLSELIVPLPSADPPQISFSHSRASPILRMQVSDSGRGFPFNAAFRSNEASPSKPLAGS